MLMGQVEPRYNFATKVMSNGVEVIVAGDRITRPGGSDYLRLLSSTATRPITLAPHTLSHHMSMVLATENGEETENPLLSSLDPKNQFTTKTYYTTYTYLTTVGETEVSSAQTTVSNVHTEEINNQIRPTSTEAIQLTNSPNLQTGIYKTTYTYLNTIVDGEQPLVMTSKHTISNTVVGIQDQFNGIEPSQVFPTTNTYLKTFELTKTLTDGNNYQIISTKDTLTQVIITDKPEVETVASEKPQSITEVTKTYFVTYTYFSTYVENEETKVKSDVSVSSDVVTEKFLLKPKKTVSRPIEKTEASVIQTSVSLPLSILATKTYKTTFTFFTTLKDEQNNTQINSRTKIIQNIVTETLSPHDLNSEYMIELNSMLNKNPEEPIVTTATLKDGVKLEITAVKEKPDDNQITASALLSSSEETEPLPTDIFKIKVKNKETSKPMTLKSKTTLKSKVTQSSKLKNKTNAAVKATKTSAETQQVAEQSMTTTEAVPTPTLVLNNHNMNYTETTPVSYSTLVLSTSTVTESGATLMPGEQVIIVENQSGGVTVIPVSDPAKKKQQNKTPSNEIQVSDILSLGSLGINSINVLAPVFNAMAGLIQNNLKPNNDAISRRNDTVPAKKTPIPVKKPYNKNPNPILEFVAGLKSQTTSAATTTTQDPRNKITTSRIPVYIPVGSFAQALRRVDTGSDTETVPNSYSNGEQWGKERVPEKWHSEIKRVSVQDTGKKSKPLPILENGIPISPGQVITANSDVIIGRPGLLGPRPPPTASKNTGPHEFKPPTHVREDDIKNVHDTIGQHSTTNYGGKNRIENGDVDMLPPPLPSRPQVHQKPHHHPPYTHSHHSHTHHSQPQQHSKPLHNSHPSPHAHPHQKIPGPHHKPIENHVPKKHDSGDFDLNPPPPPPPVRHRPDVHKPQRQTYHKTPHVESSIVPIPVHLGPEGNVENYVNPVDGRPDSQGVHNVPVKSFIKHKQNIPNRPTPNIHFINPNGIQVVPSVVNEPVHLIVSQNQHIIERSTGQPLLVNIQPSQVANVVIPHGSSTALIISGEKQHSTKGEVIDDPKPHPEPETVGFVGAEPVLKIENGDIGSIRNDVIPVKGFGEVGRPELAVAAIPHGVRYDYDAPQLTIGGILHEPTIPSQTQYDDIGLVPPKEPAYVSSYQFHGVPHYVPDQAPVLYAPSVGFDRPLHNANVPVYENKINGHLANLGVPTSGINIDVSPPGHLPPPNVVQNAKIPHSENNPSNLNENLANHQSGLVHDVPLNAQVQLGSSQLNKTPAKEVSVNTNSQNHGGNEDIQDQTQLPSEISDQKPTRPKVPSDYVPDNMSPPPLPDTEPSYKQRPPPPQTQSLGPQRFPSQANPDYPDEPVDFMKPPPHPKPHGGPYYRPGADKKKPVQQSNVPIMIPVGSNANKNYHTLKPEDLVIVPNKIQPSVDGSHYTTNEVNYVPEDRPQQVYPSLNISSHLINNFFDQVHDYKDEHKSPEDGEIQETNNFSLRPNEVFTNQTKPHVSDKNFNVGTNSQAVDINSGQQSNIGVSQTLSFENQDDKADKTKFENAETIIGSKLPNSGFNHNQAIVSIGSRPVLSVSQEESEADGAQMNFGTYGLKLNNKKEDSQTSEGNTVEKVVGGETKKGNTNVNIMDGVLTPPKLPEQKQEVMGLSPPPLVERPRPTQRPARPVTPYKFVVPTTPKTTYPIDIENDFPPVRSPDLNKKQEQQTHVHEHFQPEVDFPPVRSPPPTRQDTITPARVPEKKYPQRKPARPSVTSLPIDVPPSSTTEEIIDLVPPEEEANDSREKYFTNTFDIPNGHSKPIMKDPVRPPTTTTKSPAPPTRKKPVVYERPERPIYQQKPVNKPEKIERPRPTGFTIRKPDVISPTSVRRPEPTKDWRESQINNKHLEKPTPTFEATKTNLKTSLISSGSTTIYGDLYTDPLVIQPTKITTLGPRVTYGIGSRYDEGSQSHGSVIVVATEPILPTHTTTLTVTTTLKTIIHNSGHLPSTKTIVLTKTLISTIVDKVTETQTLVKPTTSTITQTHTISTTKTALVVPTAIFPPNSNYPKKTLKPEIFVADPHDNDHMTISVSSSMSKDKTRKNETKQVVADVKQQQDDSIFVVMSDKRPFNSTVDHFDVNRDDVTNDLNDSGLLLGGVLVANKPVKNFKDIIRQSECLPECKASRNELCQKLDGSMRCVCRPGFARMFLDRPCKPTYTYNMKLTLDRHGEDKITYDNSLSDTTSPMFIQLSGAAKEGLDRMVMQSDLRDIYHGIAINTFQEKEKKTMVDFYVQLSENTDEKRLVDVFNKSLRTSNYSLGGTEMFAARQADNIETQDFNECKSRRFHDCSEQAHCYNLKGTYTCSCKEGFTDLSENPVFPGRVCSAETIGCDYCNYHGACYNREDQVTCECFQWYTGDRCHINLKVLLIALVTIGAILLALLLVCSVLTCLKRRSRSSSGSRTNGSTGYLRYRGPPSHKQPLDKRAMIPDTSSESSVENVPYTNPPQPTGTLSVKRKSAMRSNVKGPAPRPGELSPEQRDRSLTVMIPRAKYRPVQPISPHLTMSTFAPDKNLQRTSAQIASEQKLLNYLGGAGRDGPSRQHKESTGSQQQQQPQPPPPPQPKMYEYKNPNSNLNGGNRRRDLKETTARTFEYEYKTSNMNITDGNSSGDRRSDKRGGDSAGRARRHSDSAHLHTDQDDLRGFQHRKYSAGALVSAGYEVSATVGMRHDTDLFDDDTSGIAQTNTLKSGHSQFTTLNRTGDHKTMSEARSYDETTVHPPTRTLKTHYSGSSPSSRVNNEEGHTMGERDIGSTYMMPEPHLFRPDRDRGSDISNFDSL